MQEEIRTVGRELPRNTLRVELRSYYRLCLAPATPYSAARVRRIVRLHLRAWDMTGLADAAELGVTELLSNVVRHVPDRHCTVILRRRQDRGVRVEVHDGEPGLPVPREAGPLDDGGRGLALLNVLARAWGAERSHSGGKAVWFELEAGSR